MNFLRKVFMKTLTKSVSQKKSSVEIGVIYQSDRNKTVGFLLISEFCVIKRGVSKENLLKIKYRCVYMFAFTVKWKIKVKGRQRYISFLHGWSTVLQLCSVHVVEPVNAL